MEHMLDAITNGMTTTSLLLLALTTIECVTSELRSVVLVKYIPLSEYAFGIKSASPVKPRSHPEIKEIPGLPRTVRILERTLLLHYYY